MPNKSLEPTATVPSVLTMIANLNIVIPSEARLRGCGSALVVRWPSVRNTFATMKEKQHMNTMKVIARKFTLGIVAAVCCFAFSGCEYEVPITSKPTRKVDERLLGNWTSKDGKNKMKVVRLDDSNYIVSYNGDLFRAYHSDVAKNPFVSVQILDSPKPKYAYHTWKLSDDGTLHGRLVSDKVIPDETKGSESVQKLLEKNLQNPKLFEDEVEFTKDK